MIICVRVHLFPRSFKRGKGCSLMHVLGQAIEEYKYVNNNIDHLRNLRCVYVPNIIL
jgi:hypothetical protein